MVQGPYQSKLLRLVIGQYRKGLERHQRAVRQTRSTVVTGAVVGGAWALTPLQIALKWSQRWKQQLVQLVAGERSQQLGGFDTECEDVGQSGAIAQVISTLEDDCIEDISSTQQSVRPLGGISALLSRRFPWLLRNRRIQITGFASDLASRRLVLVLDGISVCNGLSDAQQRQLQEEIAKRLEGAAVLVEKSDGLELSTSSGLASLSMVLKRSRATVYPSVSNAGGLAYSVRAFWVEVLRAVASLKRKKRAWLPAGLKGLPQSEATGKGLLNGKGRIDFLEGVASAQILKLKFFDDYSHDLEATVVSSHYVEHPLETLLNWIDKGLLWLEQRWRWLISWLRLIKKPLS